VQRGTSFESEGKVMRSRCISFVLAFGLVLCRGLSAGPIRIVVVEGSGAINNIQLQRAKAPIVRVETEGGAPAVGAVVHFLAPASGPGGVFVGGVADATEMTNSEGRATVSGFRPNRIAGQFEIRVTASYLGETATAKITQTNAEPAVVSHASRKIAILAILGGVAAGGAALALRGGGAKSAPAPAASAGAVITAGGPTFGAP
jgi:hypothetical protein